MENHKRIFGDLSEIVRFKKKEIILKEGQVEHYVSYNISGCVALLVNYNGTEISKSFSLEGSFFSSYGSFLTREPSQLTVVALEDTLIERIDHNSLQKAYEVSFEAQRDGRLIAEKLYIEEIKRTLSLISKNAEERYIELLQNKPELFRRIPLKYLASYIGVTPVSLSRLRNKLARQ